MNLLEYQDILKIADLFKTLSFHQQMQGNFEKSKSYQIRIVDLFCQNGQKDDMRVAETYSHLADMYRKQNDVMKTRDCYNEVIRICKLHSKKETSMVFPALDYLVKSYKQTSEKNKLYDIYRSIIESTDEIKYSYIELKLEAFQNLGLALNLSGETDKANECLQKAIEIVILHYGEQSEKAFYLFGKVAHVCQSQGNIGKAFYYSEKALQAGLQVFPENSEEGARGYSQLRALLWNKWKIEMLDQEQAIKVSERNFLVEMTFTLQFIEKYWEGKLRWNQSQFWSS